MPVNNTASLRNAMRAALDEKGVSVAFGLDFGTYRSMIATYDRDSGSLAVPNYSDACLGGIPSLFWRTADGKEWVGDEAYARDCLSNDPDGVCSSVKTHLHEKEIVLHGHSYTPQEIAARIVQRVVAVTNPLLEQEYIDTEFDAITCGIPVRFGAPEHDEIKRIVSKALGPGKTVSIVPEPILAALSTDFYLEKSGKSTNRPVLVFDMGAGTFDTALLQPNPKPTARNEYPYIVLTSDGSEIAGDAMDTHMEQLMLSKLPAGKEWETLKNTRHQDRIALHFSARKVKERLSMEGCTEIDELITTSAGGRCTLHITRAEYEQCIRDDIRKNVELSAKIVEEKGFWNNAALDIVLVGGSTYLPLVRKILLEKFSWLDGSHIQQRLPEKAVALGAAVYTALPSVVRPKFAHGYGVSTYNVKENREMIHVCIPSHADVPMTQKFTYATRFNGQTGVQFMVYEVDHGALGQFLELADGSQLKSGQRAFTIYHGFNRSVPADTQVELTVTLDENGILTLRVGDFGISADTEEIVNLFSVVADGGK